MDQPFRLLFVCTGNTCRSPIAMALARAALEGVSQVEITSAGRLYEGRPATPEAVEVMAGRGLDISTHKSSVIHNSMIPPPDLVVAMAREHALDVARIHPDLFQRTFPLRELVRLTTRFGPRPSGEPIDIYIRRLSQDRKPADLLGADSTEDIEDPIGKGMRAYRKTAKEIENLVGQMVAHLWPEGDG